MRWASGAAAAASDPIGSTPGGDGGSTSGRSDGSDSDGHDSDGSVGDIYADALARSNGGGGDVTRDDAPAGKAVVAAGGGAVDGVTSRVDGGVNGGEGGLLLVAGARDEDSPRGTIDLRVKRTQQAPGGHGYRTGVAAGEGGEGLQAPEGPPLAAEAEGEGEEQ
ncbi:unnamed protein product [Ectocarpus sp. 8 AP-2014]